MGEYFLVEDIKSKKILLLNTKEQIIKYIGFLVKNLDKSSGFKIGVARIDVQDLSKDKLNTWLDMEGLE